MEQSSLLAIGGSCFLISLCRVEIFEVNLEESVAGFVSSRLFQFQYFQVLDSTFQNHFSPFHGIEEEASRFFKESLSMGHKL